MNALKSVVVALAASLVLYCGAAIVANEDATPDALADDAGVDAGVVCDCPAILPPDPVCESCSSKLEYSGIFVAAFEEIVVGVIPGFDGQRLPTVQRWYFDANQDFWVQGAFGVYITSSGSVIVRSNSSEYVNRQFRVILTWVGTNPGL